MAVLIGKEQVDPSWNLGNRLQPLTAINTSGGSQLDSGLISSCPASLERPPQHSLPPLWSPACAAPPAGGGVGGGDAGAGGGLAAGAWPTRPTPKSSGAAASLPTASSCMGRAVAAIRTFYTHFYRAGEVPRAWHTLLTMACLSVTHRSSPTPAAVEKPIRQTQASKRKNTQKYVWSWPAVRGRGRGAVCGLLGQDAVSVIRRSPVQFQALAKSKVLNPPLLPG